MNSFNKRECVGEREQCNGGCITKDLLKDNIMPGYEKVAFRFLVRLLFYRRQLFAPETRGRNQVNARTNRTHVRSFVTA